MDTPLKRQLIVGSHAGKPWNCRIHAFKICEVQRVRQPTQHLAKLRAKPRLARLHAGSRPSLNFAQFEVVRYVTDGLDAHFLQLLFRARVESWQIPNVVIRERRIAAVEEL